MDAYSNRELDSKFTNLLEHMKGFEEATKNSLEETRNSLQLILKQTTEHNHRMEKIETQQVIMKTRVTTAIGILVFLIGSVLIPLAAAYLTHR